MAESRTQRRLAAILAADVVGFSRLMEADEAGTLNTLRSRRTGRLAPEVARHKGRIVKLMGDGVLVEFGSAVDAVQCALALQGGFAAANEGVAAPLQIILRIGINLGDIIVEGSDIYGGGVNIAARLEALAEPGGILLSEAVYAQIRGKVSETFAEAGELTLKNIATPVRAWRWGDALLPAAAVVSRLDSKPSIAVLPFTNMSGDPEQEYFSDGITEDIITDLSKISGLMVVARNSSFTYKGKTPDIRQVGRELGVTSVLEGAIRRAGNRLRITAQLIDAVTGHHLWADRYDRDLTDIFAVQDEVTLQIVGALRVKLRPDERALLAGSRTNNVEAHDWFLQGREALFANTKTRETFEYAVGSFLRALELDPCYAEPYAGLSMAYSMEFLNKWKETPDALEQATHFAALAIEKDPNSAFAHHCCALALLWRRDLVGSKASSQKALYLNPSFSLSYSMLGRVECYLGRPAAAIPYFERAMLLNPVSIQQCTHFLGFAYLLAGDYSVAAATFRERIRLVPKTDLSRALLAASLGHLGEIAEAQRIWHELKDINPRYSFEEHLGRLPFQNPADAEMIAEGLARAGLPE